MIFAEPLYLILLAAAAPLGVLALVQHERRRRADLQTWSEPPLLARSSVLPAGTLRVAAHVLALLALCLVLLALARPQFGEKPVVLARTGRDVLFVLDLSRSMNAEDVQPTRLAAAKRAVREVLESSPGDRVGLVVFGGSAFMQVPLTLDRAAFELFLDAANTDDMSDPGTNLGAALAVAADAFGSDSEPRYRVAVVFSDGESLEGDLGGGITRLKERRVRTFTVAVGSLEGGPIPLRVGRRLLGYHRDADGEVVVTRVNGDALRRVARDTGGGYFRLDKGGSVRQLTAELAQLERREISSRTFTQLADRFQWPLALALLALVGETVVGMKARSRRGAGHARGPGR